METGLVITDWEMVDTTDPDEHYVQLILSLSQRRVEVNIKVRMEVAKYIDEKYQQLDLNGILDHKSESKTSKSK